MNDPQQLPRVTVGEAVAERLREDVKWARLRPGQRLRQRDIAIRFGVSTTPVREAFQLLQAEGLLTIDTHRGAVVAVASADELLEMYEIREVLECLALDRAIPNLGEEDLTLLSGLALEMESSRDEHEWVDLNMRFHMQMYKAGGRPRLSSMIEKLRDAMSPYLEDLYKSAEGRRKAAEEHSRILEACRERNSSKARRELTRHLVNTRNLFMGLADLP